MHPKAKAWDEQYGFDTSWPGGGPRPQKNFVPYNRPCDECGEPVEKGYIHDDCLKVEQKRWLDILY